MNKKLTNEEIQARCLVMKITEEPYEVDDNSNIWITPNTLALIFNKTVGWVSNIAKKHYFMKKKKNGKVLYRYLDFYEVANKRSWK